MGDVSEEQVAAGRITVFLADDNLIVREGVRALLQRQPDLEVVGVAADYDELVAGADALAPQVLVTDIRMPPSFQREGIEYAISLLADGSSGYGYLLKDRLAEGDQLVQAVRAVATGGTALDPAIVNALVSPVTSDGALSRDEEDLLRLVAEGKPIKAIAATWRTTPEAVADDVEKLFLRIAQDASAGAEGGLRRLRLLHKAIVDREEQGETLSRCLPGGLAEKLRRDGHAIGETETLVATVLMSDIRGYSTIAERTPPTQLAAQLNEHRAAMNHAIIAESGTVMQFVGDAVMAVFGAPFPQADHAQRAVAAADAMHRSQAVLNDRWTAEGRDPFGLGIGVSTGEAAAALLGSEERIEYTLVGDTVNLSQRLQQWGEAGETVLSEQTWAALPSKPEAELLPAAKVKGREAAVAAYKIRSVGRG
ncbi:MAG: adenylate/guanylate cyclase domain-containing protein [Acidimicrobiales bacterium]